MSSPASCERTPRVAPARGRHRSFCFWSARLSDSQHQGQTTGVSPTPTAEPPQRAMWLPTTRQHRLSHMLQNLVVPLERDDVRPLTLSGRSCHHHDVSRSNTGVPHVSAAPPTGNPASDGGPGSSSGVWVKGSASRGVICPWTLSRLSLQWFRIRGIKRTSHPFRVQRFE